MTKYYFLVLFEFTVLDKIFFISNIVYSKYKRIYRIQKTTGGQYAVVQLFAEKFNFFFDILKKVVTK